MDLKTLIAENRKQTVIHYLRAVRKLKNPETVVVIDEDKHFFKHTTTRGKTAYYKVFDSFWEYQKSKFYNSGLNATRCNGFWIIRTEWLDWIYKLDKEDKE